LIKTIVKVARGGGAWTVQSFPAINIDSSESVVSGAGGEGAAFREMMKMIPIKRMARNNRTPSIRNRRDTRNCVRKSVMAIQIRQMTM
jgi:hypothetical protein